MPGLLISLCGVVVGFLVTLTLVSTTFSPGLVDWATVNLGHSIWLFGACLLGYVVTLSTLRKRLSTHANYESVAQLDQLSDVLIQVFIGIGVIWTAIGMRNALVSTLAIPESLGGNATHVLGRLVDGGILLALSTTIVGAIGGYLMRLIKSLTLGTSLTSFYREQTMQPLTATLDKLENIERLLEEQLLSRGSHDG